MSAGSRTYTPRCLAIEVLKISWTAELSSSSRVDRASPMQECQALRVMNVGLPGVDVCLRLDKYLGGNSTSWYDMQIFSAGLLVNYDFSGGGRVTGALLMSLSVDTILAGGRCRGSSSSYTSSCPNLGWVLDEGDAWRLHSFKYRGMGMRTHL